MTLTDKGKSGFFSRHRWLAISLGAVLAVILLASFNSMRDEVIPVRTATVERSSIRSVISTNGKIEPARNFEAHAPINTTVRHLFVKEGDRVRKGQLLLAAPTMPDGAARRTCAGRTEAPAKSGVQHGELSNKQLVPSGRGRLLSQTGAGPSY